MAHFRAILHRNLCSSVDSTTLIFNGWQGFWDLLGGDVPDYAGLPGGGLILP
jgi:hypothetical protein